MDLILIGTGLLVLCAGGLLGQGKKRLAAAVFVLAFGWTAKTVYDVPGTHHPLQPILPIMILGALIWFFVEVLIDRRKAGAKPGASSR